MIVLNKLTLLGNESVQKELMMTFEQVQSAGKEEHALRAWFFDRIRQAGSNQEKMQVAGNEYADEGARLSSRLLSAAQGRRLDQIVLQITALGALQQDDIIQRLKISDAQKRALAAVSEEHSQKVAEIGAAERPSVLMAKSAALHLEAIESAVRVLTAEQQETWRQMVGKPFKVSSIFDSDARHPRRWA